MHTRWNFDKLQLETFYERAWNTVAIRFRTNQVDRKSKSLKLSLANDCPIALQVLSWLCKKGEDILSKHGQHSATNLTAARLHERDFEKFYFTSMVSTRFNLEP